MRAASARAWAWLPLECVTTPFFACSSVSFRTAFVAPRYLNAPVFLQVLALQVHAPPGELVERLTGHHGRAVDGARDACGGGADGGKVGGVGGHGESLGARS